MAKAKPTDKFKFTSPWAWYVQDGAVLIGPPGYDGQEGLTELEYVASPPHWWPNEYMMAAECVCVVRRNGLNERLQHVCEVPDVPFTCRIGKPKEGGRK